jgi:hypothetical protein
LCPRPAEGEGDGAHLRRSGNAAERVDADPRQHLVGDAQRHRVDDEDRQEAGEEAKGSRSAATSGGRIALGRDLRQPRGAPTPTRLMPGTIAAAA